MSRDGVLALTVSDNGRGLPCDVSAQSGMGLRIMRYRAEVIGGALTVERQPRGGTRVVCRVSLHPNKRRAK